VLAEEIGKINAVIGTPKRMTTRVQHTLAPHPLADPRLHWRRV
jgi:hypothetical protein